MLFCCGRIVSYHGRSSDLGRIKQCLGRIGEKSGRKELNFGRIASYRERPPDLGRIKQCLGRIEEESGRKEWDCGRIVNYRGRSPDLWAMFAILWARLSHRVQNHRYK